MAEKENKQKSNIIRGDDKPKYIPPSTKGIPEDRIPHFLEFHKAVFDSNRELVSETTEFLLKSEKLFNVREKKTRDVFLLGDKQTKGAQSRTESATKVELVKIHDDVLKKLKFGKPKDDTGGINDKSRQTGVLQNLLKLAAPILLSGVAFVSSLTSMLSGDGIQGLYTILTKAFGTVFTTLATGAEKILSGAKMGSGLLKGVTKTTLRRIPILGSLISMGSGLSRIRQGDTIQGLIDFASAALNLFPATMPLSFVLDLFNMKVDVEKYKGSDAPIKDAWKSIVGWYNINRYDLPVIGSLTHLGEAFGSLITGDFKSFFNSMIESGLSVPYVSTLMDFFTGDIDPDTGKTIEGSGASNIKEMYDNVRNMIVEKFTGLFAGGARLAKGALAKLGVPSKIINKALSFLGFDELIDKEDKQDKFDDRIQALNEAKTMGEQSRIKTELLEEGYTVREIIDANRAFEKELANEMRKLNENMKENSNATASTAMAVANTSNSQINNFNTPPAGVGTVRNNTKGNYLFNF